MSDPKWIGTSPSNIFWSVDSKKIFFDWNPDKNISDSLYYITVDNNNNNIVPQKTDYAVREEALAQAGGNYNTDKTKLVYEKDGDIFLLDIKTSEVRRITFTMEQEYNPSFSFHDQQIVYRKENNLYAWNPATGLTLQLTDFEKEKPAGDENKKMDQQSEFLKKDALENSAVLRERKQKRDMHDSTVKNFPEEKYPHPIYIDKKRIGNLIISPSGRYITYRLATLPKDSKSTIVPEYVTESGYTETIPGRANAGVPQATFTSWVYDREKDTAYEIITNNIPGIHDRPDYLKYYPSEDPAWDKNNPFRPVIVNGPVWNEAGSKAIVVVRSQDHKDRWIMLLDAASGNLHLLDRQRDEAWIGGPGIGYEYSTGNLGWINENKFWYQSEASGYSHLYLMNIATGKKQALTSGYFEVQSAQLSNDKKYFYITTNEIEPAQTQYYRLDIADGKQTKLTTMEGGNEATLSPDQKYIAVRHSFSNHPWELFVQPNKNNAMPQQLTHLAESASYKSYPWRAPQIISFTDRDGNKVYARWYKPARQAASRPGILFVHGAGYLQDAHKWWSYYFREFMFENLLADHGYTIMDVDYSGSAGYGRNWRTAIYRHMGGKDLNDEIDAAKFMADSLNVNAKKIGIWGGSYGGFMTLMALFTHPGVFQCGGAIRSVTDWAHYNHGYTTDILNEPFTDSLAYLQSSPIYFAKGLSDHLLMLHGMEDTNVHFQDIVRLTEKLIELGKNNWNLAIYPLEDHDFEDASSWTDEYKRIYKLFEENLK